MADMEKSLSQNLHQFENRFLRAELASNKKFVFERALVIVAVGLAAGLLSKDGQGIQLLGLPITVALGFNLWMTANRIKSSNRIIAYIQLFHEADRKYPWIGWENALRFCRIWSKENKDVVADILRESKETLHYDNLGFYRPIFALHIVLVVMVAVLMSFKSWDSFGIETSFGPSPKIAIPIGNAFLAWVFCLWSIIFRPSKLEKGIEENREIWRALFGTLK